MQRYYFDHGTGALEADDTGIDYPDDATAAREAIAGLIEFAADQVHIQGPRRFAILVRTEGIARVFEAELTIRFSALGRSSDVMDT